MGTRFLTFANRIVNLEKIVTLAPPAPGGQGWEIVMRLEGHVYAEAHEHPELAADRWRDLCALLEVELPPPSIESADRWLEPPSS